ncbi:MAG TPA: DUF86 domain-containing protein [Methanosarcinaceae archaeon]|nr:DUF86 domain-containing protein [Methanosarcinaceae archaeon]
MKEERLKQYQSKIGYIIEKIYDIPEDTDSFDNLTLDGVLYRVQTSIEAAVDMAAMLVHDLGLDVSDDYQNIDVLIQKFEVNPNIAYNLKNLNGMRNAIVHHYGKVNMELILENIEEIKEILSEFIDIIEDKLNAL